MMALMFGSFDDWFADDNFLVLVVSSYTCWTSAWQEHFVRSPAVYPTSSCFHWGILKSDPNTYTVDEENGRVF